MTVIETKRVSMSRPFNALFGAAFFIALGTSVSWAQEVTPSDVTYSSATTIETPLTTAEPDAFRGLNIFIDRKLGNCVACHSNFDVASMQFLGEIGPNLDWIGDYYSRGELRAILVDSKIIFGPNTVMPAFYTAREGNRTLESFQGKTILTALEVEDVVAYLSSLTRGETFDGVD